MLLPMRFWSSISTQRCSSFGSKVLGGFLIRCSLLGGWINWFDGHRSVKSGLRDSSMFDHELRSHRHTNALVAIACSISGDSAGQGNISGILTRVVCHRSTLLEWGTVEWPTHFHILLVSFGFIPDMTVKVEGSHRQSRYLRHPHRSP